MSIHLRTHAKNKSVLISGISTILFAAYRYLDLWGNLSFLVEKLQDGTAKSVLGFFTSERGANALFFVAISSLVLSLLFEVRREKPEAQWHETPDYDLTPETPQAEEVKDREQEKLDLPPAERIFVDASPEYLMGFFDEHTSAQAGRLITPYIGKWMRVSGIVLDVDSESDCTIIRLGVKSIRTMVTALFTEQRWIERVETLRPNQPITVIGRISRVGRISLWLEQCEVVDSISAD